MNQEHRADRVVKLSEWRKEYRWWQGARKMGATNMTWREQGLFLQTYAAMEYWNGRAEQLERALARLTAAASAWVLHSHISADEHAWRSKFRELSTAIAEATAALGGGGDE